MVIYCVLHPLALNHDRSGEREERTSSWIFFRKAISSCSVSMRLSRSRRASVAASTSCHKFGESFIVTGSEIAGKWKKKTTTQKRAVTHRPERSKVALSILFLEYLFLEPARGSEKTITQKNLDRPNVIEGDRLNRNTRATLFVIVAVKKKKKKGRKSAGCCSNLLSQ